MILQKNCLAKTIVNAQYVQSAKWIPFIINLCVFQLFMKLSLGGHFYTKKCNNF